MFGFLKNLFTQANDNQVKDAIKEGAFLVDVRTPTEFSTGSVNGAVNIPLANLEYQLKKFNGKKNIVLFCRSGIRASKAKAILEQNGFTNVINGSTWQNVASAKEAAEAEIQASAH